LVIKSRLKYRATFTCQVDQSDCGVACLASIIKFHGGNRNLDQLRKLSGTARQGTTLLGLVQAAQQLGFEAEGLEAESIENLKELTEPAILHVLIDNRLQHYVVFYKFEGEQVLIGDPSKGIILYSKNQLNEIWQSKALLKLVPTASFEKASDFKGKKKQWLISLIKDDLNIVLISLFLGIVISVLGISTAIFSQKLIDDILSSGNTQKLILSLILVALLLLARRWLAFLRGLFMVRQGLDFNNRIIQNFYNNLLSLPKSFFETRKTGDLIARMNDTRRIQSVLSTLFGSVLIDLLVVFISLGFIFAYSSWVGFIMLGSLPIYFIMLLRFNKPIINLQKEVMAGYAFAESNFIDTIQGVADIKLTNKLIFFEKLNSTVYGMFQQKIADLGKLQIRFGVTLEVTGVIFMISVFGVSSWLVISKELLLGEMVALLGIAGGIIPSLNRLIVSNIQVQEALVAFDRMYEFVSLEKEKTTDERVDLQLNLFSVKNVSLNAIKGEMIALLGESGQGKSTLLQIIQKFYNPESGQVLIDENDLLNIDMNQWRDQIASIPQEPKIFNGNLLYNIVLSDQQDEYEKAITFCEASGFGKYFAELPQSYLTLVGEEGVNLSGGQKQLVVLARALYRNPKLLLLDEATSAMDRNTEKFIVDLLKKQKHERITILVTHRVKTAQQCDKIFILENGEIVMSGNSVELMKTSNFYSESF